LMSVHRRCIRWRMTEVLTVRIPPALLCKAEARAARLGLDRSKYVRSLIEEDLAGEKRKPKHKFASEDLIGSCQTSYLPAGTSATNARVREVMRRRQLNLPRKAPRRTFPMT
jgi:hypothetical protein